MSTEKVHGLQSGSPQSTPDPGLRDVQGRLPGQADCGPSYRRSRREWVLDMLAATLWAIYAMAYLQKAWATRSLMDFGLFTFYSLVVWLFVSRGSAQRHASWPVTVLALGSMVLPIIGLSSSSRGFPTPGAVIQGLSLVGMVVSVASLGRSFSIAPADRGLRTNGAYRWLRHPLYASELWFYVGYILANWSWRNLAVFCVALTCILIRIRYEEQLISGYRTYAQRIRWRLVPFVW